MTCRLYDPICISLSVYPSPFITISLCTLLIYISFHPLSIQRVLGRNSVHYNLDWITRVAPNKRRRVHDDLTVMVITFQDKYHHDDSPAEKRFRNYLKHAWYRHVGVDVGVDVTATHHDQRGDQRYHDICRCSRRRDRDGINHCVNYPTMPESYRRHLELINN